MSTLIVLMPPRDPAVHSQEWQLPELPFLLLDKAGRTQRAGRSALALLPRASATVLLIAARDLLMIATAVPPLKGPRLRQALPNVVEDHLIQDAQTCHLALDPKPLADGRQLVAAIDRGWFRFLVEGFTAAGHRNLRAVPVTRGLPQPVTASVPAEAVAGETVAKAAAEAAIGTRAEAAPLASLASAEPVIACVLGPAMQTAPALLAGDQASVPVGTLVELAVVRGASAEGLAVPASGVAATVAALAGDAPVALYALTAVPGEPSGRSAPNASAALPGAQPLTFETLARNALASRFDLCQFEFVVQPWKLDRATLRQLRVPMLLVAASLVVAVIGANVEWLMMARQRDAINAQMTELLLNAFPKTTVVLDPPGQMARQLQQLRVAAGEPSPDDFLALADGLARSLGPLPANGIATLDYRDRHIEVTFKPDVTVDADLAKRLARNGLAGAADNSTGKWTIRSAS
ncbi:type II secretion system protein GspL [Paraburkholderia caballeronis]|uniref:General secretion pathway protein L n=1 Tax=Paraburkholderia caballeronis TaxID=416943 RepID=A0A1H7H5K4_9BURK|nr:type II secretion system protein GspL [Paraburkholderia caballeronis]PXW29670.1 general secretion pathway protein L [Paraburkholderia caballeronis]PXX04929.1 general secretion pathway protein L [Paraburkholderia caballeronis]RAK05990.1 general secretion pathway protein L [Paraburkholderia caballeronis]SEB45740.1 general secretion pathway protein L [Paraburkholderia caballeronis]SEK44572.1 general secretion pathway protein L [Paraburkholderia caballeronis]